MRWDELFADLEGQLLAEQRWAERADLADRVRLERARVALHDRLAHAAGHGREVGVVLAGGLRLSGTLIDAGADWVRLRTGSGEALVPTAAIVTVSALGQWSAPAEGDALRRFGLGQALRALARDRAHVRVHTSVGSEHEGRIERVAADHLTLSERGSDPHARRGAGTELSVAYAWLTAVRSA